MDGVMAAGGSKAAAADRSTDRDHAPVCPPILMTYGEALRGLHQYKRALREFRRAHALITTLALPFLGGTLPCQWALTLELARSVLCPYCPYCRLILASCIMWCYLVSCAAYCRTSQQPLRATHTYTGLLLSDGAPRPSRPSCLSRLFSPPLPPLWLLHTAPRVFLSV